MNIAVQRPETPWSDDELAQLGTEPIPATVYYDPGHFELERKAVFLRTWLVIGHICELPKPGGYIVREIEAAKTSVLITHGKDGKLRAFHNVCPHRGARLVPTNEGEAASFTCRYHAWTFGYDGAFRSAPSFENFYVDKADCGLREVALDVCGGLIFVNFAKTPAQG